VGRQGDRHNLRFAPISASKKVPSAPAKPWFTSVAQDAGNDWNGLLETCRQDEGKKLGLVKLETACAMVKR
jgi:hypothetical protein